MEEKYSKLIDLLVADLLIKYQNFLAESQDELEYCSIVTAALVFKEIVLIQFKKTVVRDSDDDPIDICGLIESKALEIAENMEREAIRDSLN